MRVIWGRAERKAKIYYDDEIYSSTLPPSVQSIETLHVFLLKKFKKPAGSSVQFRAIPQLCIVVALDSWYCTARL